MRYYGVEEIILQGTFSEVPYQKLYRRAPTLQGAYILYSTKKEKESRETYYETFLNLMLELQTWVPYQLAGKPIPLGATNSSGFIIKEPARISGEFNEYTEAVEMLDPFGTAQFAKDLLFGTDVDEVFSLFKVQTIAKRAAAYVSKMGFGVDPNLDRILNGSQGTGPGQRPKEISMDDYLVDLSYSESQITEINSIHNKAMNEYLSTNKLLLDLRAKCLSCFEKINPTRRDKASTEIKNNDFFGAFKVLNSYYVRQGAGNIKPFEDEMLAYKLQPGQDLSSHVEALCQAQKRFANVTYLNNILHISGEDPDLTARAIQIPEEIGIWNSGVLTDAEILDAYTANPPDPFGGSHIAIKMVSPIILTEIRRFNLLQNSVIDNPRFTLVAGFYASLNENERTVNSLLRKLHNQEISMIGIEALAQERKANPHWQTQLTDYLTTTMSHGLSSPLKTPTKPQLKAQMQANATQIHRQLNKMEVAKRKRDEPEPDVQDLSDLTMDGEMAMVTVIQKHCINHPQSTTHTTAECRGGSSPSGAKQPKKQPRIQQPDRTPSTPRIL